MDFSQVTEVYIPVNGTSTEATAIAINGTTVWTKPSSGYTLTLTSTLLPGTIPKMTYAGTDYSFPNSGSTSTVSISQGDSVTLSFTQTSLANYAMYWIVDGVEVYLKSKGTGTTSYSITPSGNMTIAYSANPTDKKRYFTCTTT